MELNVDPEDIVQAEEPYDPARPINVTVCGPVETREVPAVRAGYRTEQSVTTTVAVKILAFEPRRKSAVLIAQGQDIWLAGSQAGAQVGASGAARIPALLPFVIGHLDEVWACSVTGTTDIAVLAEYWTE